MTNNYRFRGNPCDFEIDFDRDYSALQYAKYLSIGRPELTVEKYFSGKWFLWNTLTQTWGPNWIPCDSYN